MATIRKPKKKKLPKKPKASASIETWKNWEKKAKVVVAHNKKKEAEYHSKIKAKEAIKNQKAKIARLGA